MGAILAIIERASKLVLRGKILEQLYTKDTIRVRHGSTVDHLTQFREELTAMYTLILEALGTCSSKISRRTSIRSIAAIFKPGQVQSLLTDLRDLESRVVDESHICEASRSQAVSGHFTQLLQRLDAPLFRIEEQVSQVLVKLSDDEQLWTLEWMSNVFFRSHHDEISRRRTIGTGDWLLRHDRFEEWHHTSSTAIMLVYGARKLPTTSRHGCN
jgi:ankyrin repeat domain-containing protein 50